MYDLQLYPHDFSEQARASVEAERIRAAPHLDANIFRSLITVRAKG